MSETQGIKVVTERITEQYFKHATSYYISARHAAFADFSPICGLLAHYAIEMFMKGRLATSRTETQLKKIGHDLKAAWKEFKADFPLVNLDRFDGFVAELDRFWHIRYPEKLIAEGMRCSVDRSGTAGDHRPRTIYHDPSIVIPPSYHLSLYELDDLVHSIFTVCSLNPAYFMCGQSEPGSTSLFNHNAFFKPPDGAAA